MPLRPHGTLIVTRILLAGAIALPLSHMWWGHSPEEAGIDGQEAFGFVVLFVLIGLGCGAAFFVPGSLGHLLFRRRPRVASWIDLGLGVPVLAALIWAGITATYSAAT